MSSSNQWDYLRKQIDEHLTKTRNLLDANFEDWIKANEPAAMLLAANNFSPENAVSSLRSYIKTVEKWYQDQHNEVIKKSAKEIGISPNQWLLGTNPWIEQALSSDIRNIVQNFRNYKMIITEAAEFVDRNSGVTGFLSNALKGYLNPIDGISAFFGESSLHKEERNIQNKLSVAANSLEEAIVGLIESLDNIIITRWNQETINSINIIYASAQQSEQNIIPVNNNILPTNNNSIIMFMFAGLVAGIFVLLGIVVLKKAGVI